jgi:hypothetical protein
MDLTTYIKRFDEAANTCLRFTRRIVTEELPSELRFDIPWTRLDSNGMPSVDGKLLRPEEISARGYVETRKMLWVDGKVPQWVNFTVCRHTPEYTVIDVRSCGRFFENDEDLYHQREGYPPFHVLSPPLPKGWISKEQSPKFSLYWNSKSEGEQDGTSNGG